jgi:hypothetical protein
MKQSQLISSAKKARANFNIEMGICFNLNQNSCPHLAYSQDPLTIKFNEFFETHCNANNYFGSYVPENLQHRLIALDLFIELLKDGQ